MGHSKRWFRYSDITVKNSQGQNIGMSRARPANPCTDDQTAARDSMRTAGEAWRALTVEQKDMWAAWARRFGDPPGKQLYRDYHGWDVFLPAWRNRSLLGLVPVIEPIMDPAPPPVSVVEEVPTGGDTSFSFRIRHNAPSEGNLLIVRITPATATAARRPYARCARMVCGHGPQSAVPLPPDGDVVTFTGTRFTIPPGQRFGVALRIIRVDDGIHSRELFADLLRAGDETGGGAEVT